MRWYNWYQESSLPPFDPELKVYIRYAWECKKSAYAHGLVRAGDYDWRHEDIIAFAFEQDVTPCRTFWSALKDFFKREPNRMVMV